LGSQTRGQKIQDIDNSNPHASDAGTSPALFWIHRDPLRDFCHATPRFNRTPLRYTSTLSNAPVSGHHVPLSMADNAQELPARRSRAVLPGANEVSAGGNSFDTDTGPPLDLPRSG
jgi:hypothetical protein